jgi:hypothetical protein
MPKLTNTSSWHDRTILHFEAKMQITALQTVPLP